MEWIIAAQYHLLVGIALTLIVVAVVYLEDGRSGTTTSTLLEVGEALLLLAWVLLVLWVLLSLKQSRKHVNIPLYDLGTKVSYHSEPASRRVS